ncbi:MAG: tail fiber domain-containing protein [Bacteroidia bacterium]
MSKQLHPTAGSTLYVSNRYLLILASAIILVQLKAVAQNISVNSTGALPDPSAMLDVVSTNKGLLLPRVSLTGVNDNTTIPNPATSLLVYNTSASMTGGGIGFWYWNGTQWTRFSGTVGTTGNTGATGANGTNGTNGINGATGPNGLNGATGSTGAKGDAGAVGPTGVQGTNGTNGINGATGATGADGQNGATGETGAVGSDGATGVTGPTGNKGTTGATGTDGAKNAWGVSGSTGTVDGTHFIGTIDNVPLNIRVNNQRAGRIDQNLSNAYWGYQTGNLTGTGTDNTAIGSYAFSSNTTGGANVANGNYALTANTTGVRNTALGFFSMASNTDGGENTAVGMYTLTSNTNGTQNTATGNEALSGNTSGNSNTGVGYYALHDNSVGNNNTAIGYGAGYTITGNNNTFVGYFATPAGSSSLTNATAIGAGAQVSASNCLVLGAGANVGIGISAPTHKLSVNGSFNVNGVTTCTSGAWSSSDQQFKTNIANISDAMAIINQLQPRTFNFDVANDYGLNFPPEKQYGLVAQEVLPILPELVGTTTKGAVYDTAGVMITPAVTYKTLNYNAFIAILMEGIQEQQQRLDAQTTTINTLQNQVNTLIQQVQELQNHQ